MNELPLAASHSTLTLAKLDAPITRGFRSAGAATVAVVSSS